jgi:hypothetical protein
LSLNNLADPGVRRLLNRVKRLVAFDGYIEVGADGLSFANAFSHPHVQLRNVERKPRRDRWSRAWTSCFEPPSLLEKRSRKAG